MLDQVRGSKELEIVLNHTTNAWEEVTQRKSLHLCHQLARLKLAVQLRQKRVGYFFDYLYLDLFIEWS